MPAREALEALSKDELVARAEALGIDGARKFTKLELVDEITRLVGVEERGLLGRARDLLRDVVGRGLARSSGDPTSEPKIAAAPIAASATFGVASAPVVSAGPSARAPEPPVPTVTLAEIYLAQGHVVRARAILRELLRRDPTDEHAREMLARLDPQPSGDPAADPQTATMPVDESDDPIAVPTAPRVPTRPAPPHGAAPATDALFPDDPYAAIGLEPEAFVEPSADDPPQVPAMLDDAPFPARYDVDECVALAVDPATVYVYWESRRDTIDRARRALARASSDPAGSTLRVLVVEPTDLGPRVSTRDFELLDLEYGEYFVRDLPGGAIVRAAIGLRAGARFLPVAHTLEIEAPAATTSRAVARELVEWSEAGTRPIEGTTAASSAPLEREAGLFGLPPVPPSPGEDEIDQSDWIGLSSAELVRRRVSRARRAGRAARPVEAHGRAIADASWTDRGATSSDAWAAGPTSASWSPSGRR